MGDGSGDGFSDCLYAAIAAPSATDAARKYRSNLWNARVFARRVAQPPPKPIYWLINIIDN